MQLRMSPGGSIPNSLRRTPELPPSSVTVTIAPRSAMVQAPSASTYFLRPRSSVERPVPPPIATMLSPLESIGAILSCADAVSAHAPGALIELLPDVLKRVRVLPPADGRFETDSPVLAAPNEQRLAVRHPAVNRLFSAPVHFLRRGRKRDQRFVDRWDCGALLRGEVPAHHEQTARGFRRGEILRQRAQLRGHRLFLVD